MIGYIEGDVRIVKAGFAIISCSGVGYKVAATRDTLAKLSVGARASLWTHLAVRETALDLYGFMDEEELYFFDLLL
ncbi:MAG: OB-fold domain-containing protein, partial [Patescibacteria group bacterium]